MTDFKLEVIGANRVENALRGLASQMPAISRRVAYKWAQQTRAILKSQPSPSRNMQRMKWVSDKQRRYVMAAIRRGDITVPYQRSGNLANRWSAKQTDKGAELRNSAGYAVYVIADMKKNGQYWMHKNRWYVARDIIDREAPKLTAALKAEILKEWKK